MSHDADTLLARRLISMSGVRGGEPAAIRDAVELAQEALSAIADAAEERTPPAVATTEGADKAAMLAVRIAQATLAALAPHALKQCTTQQHILGEAHAKQSVRVASRKLADAPLPQSRGRQQAA